MAQEFLICFMKAFGVSLGLLATGVIFIVFLIFLNFWSEVRKWKK